MSDSPASQQRPPVPCFYGRRFLTFIELVEIGLVNNRPQLGLMIRSGQFPQPIYLSPRRPLWDAEELAEFIELRRTERDKAGYQPVRFGGRQPKGKRRPGGADGADVSGSGEMVAPTAQS
jgi:predicted DNA-binding transcriptional regulator AlpA